MVQSSEPWKLSQAGHVYVAYFRVRFNELDPMGHVNNSVYLNWMEQAAIDHASSVGFGYDVLAKLDGAFLARRHEIDYLRPANAGDRVRVTTWPESIAGARAYRRYEITRVPQEVHDGAVLMDRLYARDATPRPLGEVLVTGRTEWAFVKVTTGRPQRVPDGLTETFRNPPGG